MQVTEISQGFIAKGGGSGWGRFPKRAILNKLRETHGSQIGKGTIEFSYVAAELFKTEIKYPTPVPILEAYRSIQRTQGSLGFEYLPLQCNVHGEQFFKGKPWVFIEDSANNVQYGNNGPVTHVRLEISRFFGEGEAREREGLSTLEQIANKAHRPSEQEVVLATKLNYLHLNVPDKPDIGLDEAQIVHDWSATNHYLFFENLYGDRVINARAGVGIDETLVRVDGNWESTNPIITPGIPFLFVDKRFQDYNSQEVKSFRDWVAGFSKSSLIEVGHLVFVQFQPRVGIRIAAYCGEHENKFVYAIYDTTQIRRYENRIANFINP
jgi:hypothetical protein